jgi:hypothetical protein
MIELTIPELLPSLNRMGGAGRGHWTAWTKDKRRWAGWVLVAKHNQAHMGGMNPRYPKARIEIERHCVADIRDEDNLRAGTKFLMDALVGHGLLKDDSRECVGIPEIKQVRCKRGEQRTVVRIYPIAAAASLAPAGPAR